MRIGIVTLAHNNDNYGGTLQALAMQQTLLALGHKPFLCNIAPMSAKTYHFKFSHPLRRFREFLRFLAFVPFWNRYFAFDPAGHREFADYVATPTEAEAYICGSDQVWAPYNIDLGEKKLDFFTLNFGPKSAKRVAYAASLGTARFAPQCHAALRERLARFNWIGVREETAVKAVAEVGRLDAHWVCDPVLLQDVAFWNALADDGARDVVWPKHLVFSPFYRWPTVLPVDTVFSALTRAKAHIRIPFAPRPFKDWRRTCSVSPAAWLDGIRQSELIVTNSYHAMLFAILFHRPFCVLAVHGKFAEMNARFHSVANKLGLDDRILDAPSLNEEEILLRMRAPIDWSSVDVRLAAWRNESLTALTKALND